MHVFVSLIGDMVAVTKTQDLAIQQLHQMLMGEVVHHVENARENGDARKSFKVRTVNVELIER